MKVILTFYSGEVREYHTSDNLFTIGRSPKADICVEVDGISRQHCEIEVGESGEVFVTDLGSTNGVLIDGKSITPNKKTIYNTFLNLSLGPIQTVQLDTDEISHHRLSSPKNNQTSRTTKEQTKSQSSINIKQKSQILSKSKKNINSLNEKTKEGANLKLIAILVVSLALLGAVYFYTSNKSDNEFALPLPSSKIQF